MRCSHEMSLRDALSDSIVQAVMAADGIDIEEFEATLVSVARRRGLPVPAVLLESEDA